MIDHYSQLAARYGGRLEAYYRNAICIVIDEDTIIRYDGDELCSERFFLADKPHDKVKEGFPLDSLSVHMKTAKYYYDLDSSSYDSVGEIRGFTHFFAELKKQL